MTKRLLVVAWLVAAGVAAFPSRAAAGALDDLWDVLDNLSGPGPFSGWFATGKVACWEDGEKKVTRAMAEPTKTTRACTWNFIDSTLMRNRLMKE